MEIQHKDLFKLHIKDRIEKYIKEFPLFFYGNIFINIILILSFIFATFISAISLKVDPRITVYGILYLLVALKMLRTTTKNFLRNIRILKNIQKGNYDFGIDDHEIDNAIEFIEDLPQGKSDVERLKISLSFNKLIDVMIASRIISLHKGSYELDLKFKYQFEKILEKYSNKNTTK